MSTEAREKLEAAVTAYGGAHLVRRGGAAAAVALGEALDAFAAAVRNEAFEVMRAEMESRRVTSSPFTDERRAYRWAAEWAEVQAEKARGK